MLVPRSIGVQQSTNLGYQQGTEVYEHDCCIIPRPKAFELAVWITLSSFKLSISFLSQSVILIYAKNF